MISLNMYTSIYNRHGYLARAKVEVGCDNLFINGSTRAGTVALKINDEANFNRDIFSVICQIDLLRHINYGNSKYK